MTQIGCANIAQIARIAVARAAGPEQLVAGSPLGA